MRNFLRSNWETVYQTSSTNDELQKVLKKFGSLDPVASVPLAQNQDTKQTYKLYIGGKQTRPDTQASRSIYKHGNGKEVYCLVPDASRKDVRNAVEAAQTAFNG